MDRNVTLALEVTSDASAAASDVDKAADSYANLAREVDKAGDVAKTAGAGLDGVNEKADGLASTSSQATGALGALSAGFELAGLEQYAGGLQSASMATDFLSGVGDSLTLVLQNQKIASIAAGAATKAQATAQKALNLVMSANPIGLIIVAIVALIAGFVLLYKNSETFRDLIADVGEVGRRALGGIVDVAQRVAGFVKDKVPAAFNRAKDLVVRYIGLITTPYRKVYELGEDVAGFVREKIPAGFSRAKDLVVRYIGLITTPYRKVYDLGVDVADFVRDKVPAGFDRGQRLAANALDKVISPFTNLYDIGVDVRDFMRDKIGAAFGKARDLIVPAGEAILSPFQTVKDVIDDIIDLIDKIDLGFIADAAGALGLRTVSGRGGRGRRTVATTGGGDEYAYYTIENAGPVYNVAFNITGAIDPYSVAQQIAAILTRYSRQLGTVNVLGPVVP